jgi:HK97 gp10 family phage protein
MVGVVTFKISGLDKLEQKLKGLGPAVATKIGADSLTAGAAPITKAMRRLAPYRTGALRKSITSRAVRATGSSLLTRIIGFKSPGRYISHLLEFGTKHSAPRPFIRPAMDTTHHDVLLKLGQRLWRGIEAYSIGRVLSTLKDEE